MRRLSVGGRLDLRQHLVDGERPRLLVAGLAVERAELAVGDADVGVIGVRVDDERDDLLGMAGEASLVRDGAELEEGRVGEEVATLLAVEPLAVADLLADLVEH